MRIKDAAKHIIFLASSDGSYSLTPLKLQKILYYAQGFNYIWNGRALFSEQFEAWQYGPVNRDIYSKYKKYGQRDISYFEGSRVDATEDELETLRTTWDNFKQYNAFDLVRMTHSETPWIEAYGKSTVIDNSLIKEYFIRAYS